MQQPADVVVRPAIRHVPRSVVCDAHERTVRCGLGIVPVSSETEDKFEDAMEVTPSSPLPEVSRVLVRRTSGDTRHKIQGAFARRIRTVSSREAERCGGLRQ